MGDEKRCRVGQCDKGSKVVVVVSNGAARLFQQYAYFLCSLYGLE